MPKVTIWIREEDKAKWDALGSKPEFIHSALNDIEYSLDDFKSGKVKADIRALGGMSDTLLGSQGKIPAYLKPPNFLDKSFSARKKK